MEKHLKNITIAGKKNGGKGLSITGNPAQKEESDVLALILRKISLLEEKLDRIEYQTKTPWVN